MPTGPRRLIGFSFKQGGDGPKRLVIEEVRERHRLQERVAMLGSVEPVAVRDVSVALFLFLSFRGGKVG